MKWKCLAVGIIVGLVFGWAYAALLCLEPEHEGSGQGPEILAEQQSHAGMLAKEAVVNYATHIALGALVEMGKNRTEKGQVPLLQITEPNDPKSRWELFVGQEGIIQTDKWTDKSWKISYDGISAWVWEPIEGRNEIIEQTVRWEEQQPRKEISAHEAIEEFAALFFLETLVRVADEIEKKNAASQVDMFCGMVNGGGKSKIGCGKRITDLETRQYGGPNSGSWYKDARLHVDKNGVPSSIFLCSECIKKAEETMKKNVTREAHKGR